MLVTDGSTVVSTSQQTQTCPQGIAGADSSATGSLSWQHLHGEFVLSLLCTMSAANSAMQQVPEGRIASVKIARATMATAFRISTDHI